MIDLLLLSVLVGLFCNGLQIVTDTNMILEPVSKWLDSKFVKDDGEEMTVNKLYFPILYCIRCMPSIYGTIFCLAFLPIGVSLLWQIPIVCISASATSTILSQLYD